MSANKLPKKGVSMIDEDRQPFNGIAKKIKE